jgi:multidrug resistance efflux pump
MTVIENLLRLHRWQLDERRRYLSELESLRERLHADIVRLGAEIESQAALPDPAGENYSRRPVSSPRLIERHRKLEHSVTELDRQIADAQAEVVAAEHEVGVYELTATHRMTSLGGAAVVRARRARPSIPRPTLVRQYGS